MMLYVFPLLIIALAIGSYILGKKNGMVKEVIKTIQLPPVAIEETNLYADETSYQFEIRCHNSIVEYLNEHRFVYYKYNNSFQVNIELEDGSTFLINIDCVHNLKCIEFRSKLTNTVVPHYKLGEVAELINRLNAKVMLNPYYLDYGNRTINIITSYFVGDHRCFKEYLSFYLTSNYKSLIARRSFQRVIIEDDEPALVALDFAN
ncbi:hypothetical protein [Pedobacter cryotolerans]|uniref:Uncharacterized protein n=1 Tax=Pedobacter cryotolerans TaxID=2571270 RepID=A0A4U1BU74_9SPHI|nr:hypothetical protein [Pedobacter cryotolerans]TKB96182.1 hypothetical protein FA045_18580 [Pedobacter cryotolerans]